MKKVLKRIVEMMIVLWGVFYNFCYADAIAPDFPITPSPRVPDPNVPDQIANNFTNVIPLIVIGIVVVVIVATLIVILEKSLNSKDKKN